MRLGHVVALVVHIAHRLPVDGQLLGPELFVSRYHRGGRVWRHLRIVACEHLRDGRLIAGQEAHEDEPHPDVHLDGLQAVLDPVELRQAVWESGAAQGPVEVVAPAVERAGDHSVAPPAARCDDSGAAMPAQVVERANPAIHAAQDEGAFARHVERDIGTRLGDVRHVAGQLPVAAEQNVLLDLRQLVAVIDPRRQSAAIPLRRCTMRGGAVAHRCLQLSRSVSNVHDQHVMVRQCGRFGHRAAAFRDRLTTPAIDAGPSGAGATEMRRAKCSGSFRLQCLEHELVIRQQRCQNRFQHDCIGGSFDGNREPQRFRHPEHLQGVPSPTVETMTILAPLSPSDCHRGSHGESKCVPYSFGTP